MCEFENNVQGLIAQNVHSNDGESYSDDDANDNSSLVPFFNVERSGL